MLRTSEEKDLFVQSRQEKKKHIVAPVIVGIVIIIILFLLPTGFEGALNYQGTERCSTKVIAVDNSMIHDNGLLRTGEQTCELLFLDGKFKGKTAKGVNQLKGSLENDKIFQKGDKALVTVNYTKDRIDFVMMVDHYRMNQEIILALLFAVFLLLFAGKTGICAIISFLVTVLMIWKLLIPLYLKGYQPVLVGVMITVFLTTLIISLVYGFDRRSLAAVSGSVLGILTTCILAIFFTDSFQIHGAVMSGSESLLYAGFENLDLTKIFMASIFIGSSGAMMDLAVDITSAVGEVVAKCPNITAKEAIHSGLNVGRAAMGTMTTTLLLAYSGGCVSLFMVFMAQGTPITHILNYKYVAAEILHTVLGSFGLITVAPFTAITAGIILTHNKK